MKKPGKTERGHFASDFGTDAQYLHWLSLQPSCIDGTFHQELNGVGRNIACHVRRVNRGAGTGFKPPYSAIPMTQAQHLAEETYPIEWRVEMADEYLRRWIETRKRS